MFYKYPDIPTGIFSPEKAQRIEAIAEGLPRSEIQDALRHVLKLKLPMIDELLEGDVTQSGFTVYLGGFDWVTYPTPAHILQKYPEFLPLPQQVFRSSDEEL